MAGVNLLERGGVVEGQVIRVILPPGSVLTSESIQATIWKTQIKQLGFARCVHEGCRISFLSVKGMEAHLKTCKRSSSPGDYVICPGCGERFKTFSTMAKHHVKMHGCTAQSLVASRPLPFVDDNVTQEIVENKVLSAPNAISLTTTTSDFDVNLRQDDFDLPSDIAFESREALRDRIMAESRRISTARPRGRPRKSSSPTKDFSISGHQYKDTFDVKDEISDQEDPTMQHLQFVQLQARRVQPSSDMDLVQMRTMDGKIVWVKKAILNSPSTYETDSLNLGTTQVRHKFEDDFASKEAKLANYQNLVIKYEHLAEQANKMAMEERSNQLLRYEEELKRREFEAKKKLSGAVEVLQKNQSGSHHEEQVPASEIEVEVQTNGNVAEATTIPSLKDTYDQDASFSLQEIIANANQSNVDGDDTEAVEDTETVEMEIVIPDIAVAEQYPIEHYEMVDATSLVVNQEENEVPFLVPQKQTKVRTKKSFVGENGGFSVEQLDSENGQAMINLQQDQIEEKSSQLEETVNQFEQDSSCQQKEQTEENNLQVAHANPQESSYQIEQISSSNRTEVAEEKRCRQVTPEKTVHQIDAGFRVTVEEPSGQTTVDVTSQSTENILQNSQEHEPPTSESHIEHDLPLEIYATSTPQGPSATAVPSVEVATMTRPTVGRPRHLLNNNNPVKRVPDSPVLKTVSTPKPDNVDLPAVKSAESGDVAMNQVAQHNNVADTTEQLRTSKIPSYFSIIVDYDLFEETSQKLESQLAKEIFNNSKKGRRGRRSNSADLPPTTPVLSKMQKAARTPMIAISEIAECNQKRKRKPALNESEFELSSAVAKRRKPTSSGKVSISVLDKSSTPSPSISQTQGHKKQRLFFPQIAPDQIRRKGQDELTDLAQEELVSDNGHLDRNNYRGEPYNSAQYLEDEFLMEPLSPPPTFLVKIESDNSSKTASNSAAATLQPTETAQLGQSTPPEQPIKPRRGRPPRKTLDSFVAPEPEIKTEFSTTPSSENPNLEYSEFETPVSEKRRRGRKKKDPNAMTPLPVNPSPVYESVPGKRMRKKIDYRELNGDIDRSNDNPKIEAQSTLLAGDSAINEKQGSLTAESEAITTPKSRRGRKRKITDENASPKTGCGNVTIICGKCEQSFKNKVCFQQHIAALHGGLARPSGESQDFTEEEMFDAARDAFTKVKKVICFRCNEKTFTTILGLKYHLHSCGKSLEEVESMKLQCKFCQFRSHPHNLRIHMQRHNKPVSNNSGLELENLISADQVESSQLTPGGRIRRHAASKASIKVANAIKQLKTAEDGVTFEADNNLLDEDEGDYSMDEEYTDQNNLEVAKTFKAVRNPNEHGVIFKCKLCDVTTISVIEIRKHAIGVHAEEIVGDDEDDEMDDDVSNESDIPFENEDEDVVSDLGIGDKCARRYTFTEPRGKTKALLHDVQMLPKELAFRNKNFDKNNFERFHSRSEDWIQLDESAQEDYLPLARTSIKFESRFCHQSKESTTDGRTLQLFEATLHNDAATIFAGGPIWASAWCPMKNNDNTNVVALYADKSFETESFVNPSKESVSKRLNSLIQFWTYKKSHKSTDLPVFSLGIAHNFGHVRSLQWCPSGGQGNSDSGLARLGLLAAGCEDGTVRIFSVPEFEALPNTFSTPHRVFKCDKAIVTLRRPDNGEDAEGKLSPCVKVVWFRGCRHRVIAASFTDGYVGLWDIETTSSLLRDEKSCSINPYRFFRTHLRNNQTFFDLSSEADEEGFPLYLLTGSTDRNVTSWDLGSALGDVPVRECRKHFVTDVTWLNHYPGNVSISHDDSCLQSNTRSVIMDTRLQDSNRNISVVAQNSAIWSQAYSPLKNILVSSTAAGEVILFVMPPTSRNMNAIKELHHSRVLVYRSDLGKFNLDPNPGKLDATYLKTYQSLVKEGPVIRLLDMPTNDFTQTLKEELLAPRFPMTMVPENPEIYPLVSINCLALNTNLNSMTLLFSGGQSGLGRFHHLSMLDKS